MSDVGATTVAVAAPAEGAALWGRQIGGIVRLELRKVLFSRRALIGWGLAAAPVALLGARMVALLLLGGTGSYQANTRRNLQFGLSRLSRTNRESRIRSIPLAAATSSRN